MPFDYVLGYFFRGKPIIKEAACESFQALIKVCVPGKPVVDESPAGVTYRSEYGCVCFEYPPGDGVYGLQFPLGKLRVDACRRPGIRIGIAVE